MHSRYFNFPSLDVSTI